jgi:hypothetical protein
MAAMPQPEACRATSLLSVHRCGAEFAVGHTMLGVDQPSRLFAVALQSPADVTRLPRSASTRRVGYRCYALGRFGRKSLGNLPTEIENRDANPFQEQTDQRVVIAVRERSHSARTDCSRPHAGRAASQQRSFKIREADIGSPARERLPPRAVCPGC